MSVQVSYKKQTLLSIIGLLILFVSIEAIANVWWITQVNCEFEENEIFMDMDNKERRQLCVDLYEIRTSGMELIPNQESQSITINSLGFRGDEFSVEKQDGIYRIFMLGGSTMFGHGATSDDTTIPGYFQELFDNNEISQVEIINAGIQGADSFTELDLIKNKILNFSPDMLIIYDGWNDLREENTSTTISNNWNSMCAIGEENNFEVVIALQPIAGFGKKSLTSQEEEYMITGTNYANTPLIDSLNEYQNYSSQLQTLKNCSLTLSLTNVFDQEISAIYWDQGHVSDKGNSLVAQSILNQILFLLPEFTGSYQIVNDIDNQTTEKTFDEYIIYFLSGYKTPIMINSILPFQELSLSQQVTPEISPSEQIKQNLYSTFTTNSINYNDELISIVLQLDHNDNTLEIKTTNKDGTNYKNITYFIKIFKDEKLILSDHIFAEEIFLFNIIPNNNDSLKISGDRQYNHNAMIMSDSNPPEIIGSIFKNNENYSFSFDILTIDDKNDWIFSLTDFNVVVNSNESYGEQSTMDEIKEKNIQISNYDLTEFVTITQLDKENKNPKNMLFDYAIEWKSGKISDDAFLDNVKNHELYNTLVQNNQKNHNLPDWLENNAGRVATIILTDNDPEKFDLTYIDESIFPCNQEYSQNPDYDCWNIELNSDGFRHSEFTEEKQNDTYRIIAVGGSTTFSGESNDSTWPGHLHKLVTEKIPEMKIEVINAGLQGATTEHEIELIKNKLLLLNPDLIIMYDGWNDALSVETKQTIKNWESICKLGNDHGFETSIIIQPLPISGKRIISNQELNNILRPSASSPVEYVNISQKYVDSFSELNKTCSHTADLRGIFDYIHAPIFYDGGHILNHGNKILASNIFSSISSEFFGKTFIIKYNDLDKNSKFSNNLLFAAGVNLQNKFMANLSLENAIFDKSILKYSDFENSNLENARFVFSDLTGANLSGADLTGANLSGADLTGANLSGADLTEANLSGADLTEANLSGADLTGANLSKANISQVNLDGAIIDQKWIYCNSILDMLSNESELPFETTMSEYLKTQC